MKNIESKEVHKKVFGSSSVNCIFISRIMKNTQATITELENELDRLKFLKN